MWHHISTEAQNIDLLEVLAFKCQNFIAEHQNSSFIFFWSPLSPLSRRLGMRPTSASFRPKFALRRMTSRRLKPVYWVVSSWRAAWLAASASSARRSPPRPSVRLKAG